MTYTEASNYVPPQIKDPREAMAGKEEFDDGKKLNVTMSEITESGLVILEYNIPVLLPEEFESIDDFINGDDRFYVEFSK